MASEFSLNMVMSSIVIGLLARPPAFKSLGEKHRKVMSCHSWSNPIAMVPEIRYPSMLPPFSSGSPACAFPLATWVIRAAYPTKPPTRVPIPTSMGPRWMGMESPPQKSKTTGPISGRNVIEEMTSIPGKMTSPRPMKRASLLLTFFGGMGPSTGTAGSSCDFSITSPLCSRNV